MGPLSLLYSFSLLIFVAYAFPSPAIEAVDNSESERVINGKEAELGQFPYVIRIAYVGNDDSTCTGSVISTLSVLSAAHCVTTNEGEVESTERYEGFYGSIQRQVDETKVNFHEFRVHENYHPVSLHNDIAILVLDKEVMFGKYLTPVTLPKADITHGGDVVIAIGWGLYQFGEQSSSKVLRYTLARALNSGRCSELANDDLHVCITSEQNGICVYEGDSGGPLVKKDSTMDVIIGINSYGFLENECNNSEPDFFISTSAYHSWIEQNAVGEITYA